MNYYVDGELLDIGSKAIRAGKSFWSNSMTSTSTNIRSISYCLQAPTDENVLILGVATNFSPNFSSGSIAEHETAPPYDGITSTNSVAGSLSDNLVYERSNHEFQNIEAYSSSAIIPTVTGAINVGYITNALNDISSVGSYKYFGRGFDLEKGFGSPVNNLSLETPNLQPPIIIKISAGNWFEFRATFSSSTSFYGIALFGAFE